MKVKLFILNDNATRVFSKETEIPDAMIQITHGISFWMNLPALKSRVDLGIDSIVWKEETNETWVYLNGAVIHFLANNPKILLESDWKEGED